MTFTKTWWGPLLLRIQVLKIRKHLNLFLSSIPRWFPSPSSYWSLALGVWEACCWKQHPSVVIKQKDTPGQLLYKLTASTRFPVAYFSRKTTYPIIPFRIWSFYTFTFWTWDGHLNSTYCIIISQLYNEGLTHPAFLEAHNSQVLLVPGRWPKLSTSHFPGSNPTPSFHLLSSGWLK